MAPLRDRFSMELDDWFEPFELTRVNHERLLDALETHVKDWLTDFANQKLFKDM